MLELTPRVTTLAVISTATVIVAGAIVVTWWQRRRNRIPTKWRRVGELVNLDIYPLKSGQSLSINEAECTNIGIRTEKPMPIRDRFFVVVTEKGTTKTARQHPNMLKIKAVKANDDSIVFQAPGMEDLVVKKPKKESAKKIDFTMWEGEHVQCVDCGDEAANWIHSFLNLKEDDKIRLGFFVENLDRKDLGSKAWSPFKKAFPRIRATDGGVFMDFAAFMIINEASVKDLCARVGESCPSVEPSWFRPNFVVRGPKPYEEDRWNFVKIGDSAVFQYIKPCTRCVFTTINPETATKDPNMEPLKTLKTYRMLQDPKLHALEKSPVMGCYLGLRHPGSVKLGDPVYVGCY